MIYWKQTNVCGYPPHGVRVFAAYEGRIIQAMIVGTNAGDRWDIYDTPDGACEVGEPLPLHGITDWSEMNMPLTFQRKAPPTIQRTDGQHGFCSICNKSLPFAHGGCVQCANPTVR